MSLSEKLQWVLTADASGAVSGFQKAGAAADKELGKADPKVDKLGGTMTKVGAGAMAFAGVAGVALFKAAGSFQDLALEASKFADATGTSVEEASRFMEAVGDLGVDVATAEKSLGFMNKTLGKTPEAFAKFDVAIATNKDGTTDVVGTYGNVIDRLNSIPDAGDRAAAGTALLGRGWMEMAEVIKGGSATLKASMDSVSDAQVINPAEVQKAKDMRAAMDEASDAVTGLLLGIGAGAAPVISTLASGFASVVDVVGKLDAVSGGAVGTFGTMAAAGIGLVGALSFVGGQAIKLRNSFTTMGTDGVRSLNGLGKAAVGMGVAMGVASAVMIVNSAISADNADKKRKLTAATDNFVTALKAEAGGQKDAVAAQVAASIADADLIKNATKLGLSTQDLADIITGKQVPAWDLLKTQVNDMTGPFKRNTDEWNANAVAMSKLETSLTPLVGGLADAKEQIVLSNEVSKELGVTTDDLGDSTDDASLATAGLTVAQAAAKGALDAQAAATAEATRKSDAFAASLQGQLDKLDALYPKEYNAVTAKYDYADAQKQALIDTDKLNTSLGDSKATAEDQAAAFDTARDSILGASEKYATLDGAVLGSQGAIARQISSLEAQRDTLAPGSPLRAFLDQYIADLENIPSNISTIMDLHISQGQVTTKDGDVIGKRSGKRASGGPVSAGGVYEVTEGGKPEMYTEGGKQYLLPGGNGQVTPFGGSGGGQTVVINVPVSPFYSDNERYRLGQAVVNALATYNRRNGTS